MDYIKSYVSDGLNLLLQQDKEQPKLNDFFKCFLERYQALEDAMSSTFKYSKLVHAIGTSLDKYGNAYQVTRFTNDDDAYRRAIIIKILVTKCTGTINEMLSALCAMTNAKQAYIAEYSCHISITLLKPTNLYQLKNLVNSIKPAGVSYSIQCIDTASNFLSTKAENNSFARINQNYILKDVDNNNLLVSHKIILDRGFLLGIKIHTKHVFKLSDNNNYLVSEKAPLKITDDAKDILYLDGTILGFKVTDNY